MHPGLRPSADRSVREVCQRYDAAVHRVNQQHGSEQGGVWGKLCAAGVSTPKATALVSGLSFPCSAQRKAEQSDDAIPACSASVRQPKTEVATAAGSIDMTCGGRT